MDQIPLRRGVSSAEGRSHYRFEPVVDGVRAAIAAPDGYAICNSGAVDVEDGILVFDTGLTAESAHELRTRIATVSGRPPAIVVNSHQHIDHSFGNSEFADLPIWSTRRTRELFVEAQSVLQKELSVAQLDKDLAELAARRSSMTGEWSRRDLEFTLQIYRALRSSVETLRMTPPTRTFESTMSVPGRRGAELKSFGHGHTQADAILHLVNDGVLFAGDLVCVGIQPSRGDGDPDHWLVVLDALERLGTERIVPGHGPITNADGIAETRGYLHGVLAAAEASTNSPVPAGIRRWEGSVSLEQNLAFARGWVRRADRTRAS